ncbi:MAG: thioredoxin family protein [Deltaproteobacteria bacterium]|nr:thioredoxin family protein [Deltaproteobacteria bacterium]
MVTPNQSRVYLAVACSVILIAATRTACSPAQPAVVTIESVWLANPLTAGKANLLKVKAQIAPGWHINSNYPAVPYYVPTRVSLAAVDGFKVGEVSYPAAHNISLPFAPGETLSVYTGQVEFEIPITPLIKFNAGRNAALSIQIFYQACNDRECLRPAVITKSAALAFPGPATSGTANVHLNEAGLAGSRNLLADIFTRRGYIAGFLFVLLGGLALNLTPCVYPLIGVTVAYFGYEGGGPRRVVVLAVVYVLGIALTFSAVGVAAALSGGLFGAALQNPYVLGIIASMLLLLAAASFGFISLQPPVWLMQRAGSARRGYAGALVMGLGMGVVAAPCIGPIVLGLLLMVQQSENALLGFALFFTLAIGLGLPYIALALAAGSIPRLPRSGEWLAWVEQLFGFVLVGLALYFIDPLFRDRLMTRILPYYAAGVGIFLGFVSAAGRNWRPFFVFRSALGAAAAALLVYLLITARGSRNGLNFQPFDPALLQAASVHRKPVVVDFSADWCVPCREMEHTTFADPAVMQQAGKFVWLKANLTATNPHNTALMKQFEVAGVPTSIFIDSSGTVRASRAGYIGPQEFLGYLEQVE